MQKPPIALRLSNRLLNLLEQLALEKGFAHDGHPNRSRTIIFILNHFFSKERKKQDEIQQQLANLQIEVERMNNRKQQEDDELIEILEQWKDRFEADPDLYENMHKNSQSLVE